MKFANEQSKVRSRNADAFYAPMQAKKKVKIKPLSKFNPVGKKVKNDD
jgi:hypothetical protein